MIKAAKQLQASLERQLGSMNSTASGAWNAACTLEDAQFDRTHPFRLLIPITEAVMDISFVGDAEHHNHVTQELILSVTLTAGRLKKPSAMLRTSP